VSDGRTLTGLPVPSVPMTVTYRRGGGPLDPPAEAAVVDELDRVGYLRIFRRINGCFLHVAAWDVLNVDGQLQ
jgi:hypothetical protein